MSTDLEDHLAWLAERYTVELYRNAERDRWHLELYGPNQNQEIGGTSFDGSDLHQLLAIAQEWSETPLADRLPEREWVRLYQAAARTGKSPQDLLRQGTRELLDRLETGSDDSA